jgi:hypothetical protein
MWSGWPAWRLASVAPIAGRRLLCKAASTSSRRASPEPVLLIEPWVVDSPDWLSDGVSPSQPASLRGEPKRCQSPPSSRCSVSAVSVSIPRNARSCATVGQMRGSCASREALLERLAAGDQPVECDEQIDEDQLGRFVLEDLRPEPAPVLAVPGRGARIDQAVDEQQLRDTVPRARITSARTCSRRRAR